MLGVELLRALKLVLLRVSQIHGGQHIGHGIPCEAAVQFRFIGDV